jgi:hypothetical protein
MQDEEEPTKEKEIRHVDFFCLGFLVLIRNKNTPLLDTILYSKNERTLYHVVYVFSCSFIHLFACWCVLVYDSCMGWVGGGTIELIWRGIFLLGLDETKLLW